jgi:hypothetical protein
MAAFQSFTPVPVPSLPLSDSAKPSLPASNGTGRWLTHVPVLLPVTSCLIRDRRATLTQRGKNDGHFRLIITNIHGKALIRKKS